MAISRLTTLAKTATTATQYVQIEDASTQLQYKFLIQSMFPSLSTTGVGGQDLFISVTNSNQLNFKGLISADTKMTVTTASNNLVLTLVESAINLANCDNSTAAFLTSLDFSQSVTGVNNVVNGGTGLSSIAQGSILYASAQDTLASSTAMSTNGQLLIGNATNGYPSVATLTQGDNMTITNGAGTITLAANITTLAANLSAATYNINLAYASGESWISGDGSDEGIAVDAAGKVYIGQSTPTAFYSDTLNVKGGIAFDSATAPTIAPVAATGGTNGVATTISGGGAAAAGGIITVSGGNSSGSDAGGNAIIAGGTSGSGTAGSVLIKTANTTAVTIDANQNVTTACNLISGTKGVYMRAAAYPQVIKYQGSATDVGADASLIAHSSIIAGIITVNPGSDHSKQIDTAANLVSGLKLEANGDAFDFVFINLGDDSENRDITLTTNTGVTLVGNMHISSPDTADASIASGSAQFRIARTGSSAVTIFRIA